MTNKSKTPMKSEASPRTKADEPAKRGRPRKAVPVARTAPGRPEGKDTPNLRERILDAAEQEFAVKGYAGTSFRHISATAKVTQGLLTYYFEGKENLFQEVFLRRAHQISDARMANLEALRQRGDSYGVEDIVEAFLAPTLALRSTPGGRAFLRLQAKLHTEPPEISYSLRRDAYDKSTQAFVDALQPALPMLSKADIYWRVTFMIGAYLYAFSGSHRLEELAKGVCEPSDAGNTLRQLTAFVVGGLTASSIPIPA
jgi:AcrR family transcriptional regulator